VLTKAHKTLLTRLVREEASRVEGKLAGMPYTGAAHSTLRTTLGRLREIRDLLAGEEVEPPITRRLLAEIVRWHGERGVREATKFAKVDPAAMFDAAIEEARVYVDSVDGRQR
jgi:hypothetical protein